MIIYCVVFFLFYYFFINLLMVRFKCNFLSYHEPDDDFDIEFQLMDIYSTNFSNLL